MLRKLNLIQEQKYYKDDTYSSGLLMTLFRHQPLKCLIILCFYLFTNNYKQ